MFNILIGCFCIALIAFGAWRFGGQHRRWLAIAIPALGCLIVPFVRVAADVYNDTLATFFSVLCMVIASQMISSGLTTQRVVLIAFTNLAAMSTRSTNLATLIISMIAICAAAIISNRPLKHRIRNAFLGVTAVFTVLVAGLGWWFAKNHRQSGSWFRAVPKFAFQGRANKSMSDNLTNWAFWGVVPQRLLGGSRWSLWGNFNFQLSLSIVLICFLGYFKYYAPMIKQLRVHTNTLRPSRNHLIFALAILHIGLLYGQQLQHAIGYGQISPRYFLGGLAPIGLIMALGLSGWSNKWRSSIVLVIICTFFIGCITDQMRYLERRYPQLGSTDWGRLTSSLGGLNLQPIVFVPLFAGLLIGLAMIGYGLFDFQRRAPRFVTPRLTRSESPKASAVPN